MNGRSDGRLVALVLMTVVIGVASALILESLARMTEVVVLHLLLGISVVLMLNGARFWVWVEVHRAYPLTASYPLTALYFPLIMLSAVVLGEEVTAQQTIGSVLVALGVAINASE